MAIINYTDQLKYAGRGYLDAKMMPVKTYEELKSIPQTQRFEGLTIVVLNDGHPQDYWLVGGTSNSCWKPKTATNFDDLRLTLEEGFLKLTNDGIQLGEAIDFNDFFPSSSSEIYIKSVDYATVNGDGENGIFMCFTYSDGSKKYLNMGQFLSNTYEAGSGIVVENNVISLDSAIIGKIETIEVALSELSTNVENNKQNIDRNKISIDALKARVDALTSNIEGATPDGETIGVTNDERKALCVKILEKDGNILKVDTNNGEIGLYASLSYFCEDEELNEE
jgi:hypothetical protein